MNARARTKAGKEPFARINGFYLNAVGDSPDHRDYDYQPALVQLAPSIDPPDGRIPWAPGKREESDAERARYGVGPYDSHLDLDTGERCLSDGATMAQTLAALNADPRVEYAEEDQLLHPLPGRNGVGLAAFVVTADIILMRCRSQSGRFEGPPQQGCLIKVSRAHVAAVFQVELG